MKKDLLIKKGSTFEKDVFWLNCDGSNKDLAGYSGKMQIRDSVNNRMLIELTEENGRLQINPQTSSIRLRIPAEVSTALPLNVVSGMYDLEMSFTMSSGEVYVRRILEGKIIFSNEVSR